MTKYFHFTLGPVQTFVAQARRSKDLWGGSFLLSWLSAVAINTVQRQDKQNEILFPIPDPNFMSAVVGEGTIKPKQGGIPNRFKGLTAKVAPGFVANDVVVAVRQTWIALGDLVWKRDMATFFEAHQDLDSKACKTVWDRQVNDFWEASWVITSDKKTSNLLDRRKNWRLSYAQPEPGDKCMMMEGWQELSGLLSNSARTHFWEELRAHVGKTDLEENEQLCALAFIKRRFARYFGEFTFQIDQSVQGISSEFTPLNINGWSFSASSTNNDDNDNDYDPTHVPSLSYLAAVPFIQEAYDAIEKNRSLQNDYVAFIDHSKRLLGLPSTCVDIDSLNRAASDLGLPLHANSIDAVCFFPDTLSASSQYQALKPKPLARAYSQFCKAATLQAAAPYYALLLMDGDLLGSQMSDATKHQDISEALNEFTSGVNGIIATHNGFLIYAGGDDVLAFMPINSVVECALELERLYANCFASKNANSTLSGAIQIAHVRTPLMKIVSEAHALLDDVAKDEFGRHSLAIRINKPGGVHAQWAMPYQRLTHTTDKREHIIASAMHLFINKPSSTTNGLLFKLISVMQHLPNMASQEDEVMPILQAEYFHSGEQLGESREALYAQLQDLDCLLAVCRIHKRDINANTGKVNIVTQNNWQADGLKIVRFFATKGYDKQGATQ